MELETVAIESLTLDPQNARRHSSRNLDAIKASLDKFGQRKPIVVHQGTVIAGNGTLEAARLLGWKEISISRCPDDWDSDTAKAYALADNRSSELAEWDSSVLVSQLAELDENGWDVGALGFTGEDVKEMQKGEQILSDDENAYTAVVNIPQYEIVGEKPEIHDLYDYSKMTALCEEIGNTPNLDPAVKLFLFAAANRHIVFNYKKIAEYYPHATPEIQKLMEKSALIIIDINDAIHYGYVDFMDELNRLEKADRSEG